MLVTGVGLRVISCLEPGPQSSQYSVLSTQYCRERSERMADYKKPLPQSDPTTAPYWESLKAHQMKIQRCNDTGKFFFYPRGMSPFTLSGNLSWEAVSGK